ncbi:hypothetical protein L7F22_040505 [Adiantum nelumboides]|nr:hypothetical protein [Adiantum nelumboides]
MLLEILSSLIFSIFESELDKLELSGWLLLVDRISVCVVMLLDIMLTLVPDNHRFVDRLRVPLLVLRQRQDGSRLRDDILLDSATSRHLYWQLLLLPHMPLRLCHRFQPQSQSGGGSRARSRHPTTSQLASAHRHEKAPAFAMDVDFPPLAPHPPPQRRHSSNHLPTPPTHVDPPLSSQVDQPAATLLLPPPPPPPPVAPRGFMDHAPSLWGFPRAERSLDSTSPVLSLSESRFSVNYSYVMKFPLITPDTVFYSSPRFVTHIDDYAIQALTKYYASVFPPSNSPGVALLDMCSSWISHYPKGYKQERIAGLGLNEEELKRNPLLTEYAVQDLNQNATLPYEDNSFDFITNAVPLLPLLHSLCGGGGQQAVLVTTVGQLWRSRSNLQQHHFRLQQQLQRGAGGSQSVCRSVWGWRRRRSSRSSRLQVSVDYLAKPLEVFREMRRVLKPGGTAIMSFSNRCFWTKAISIWTGTGDVDHVYIVGSYFHYAGGYEPPQALDISPNPGRTDPMYVVFSRKLQV